MHQGKELKEVAERQPHIGNFAKKIGVSRETLYQMFKRPVLKPKHVEKLLTLGIHLTKSDLTKPDSKKPHNLNGSLTYKKGEHTPMNDLITLSIEQLIALQGQQEDPQAIRAIQQVITYKQYAQGLERDNKRLEREIELLNEIILGLKKKK